MVSRRVGRVTRRDVGRGALAFGTALLAGCLGGDDEGERDDGEDEGDEGDEKTDVDPALQVGDRVLYAWSPVDVVDPDTGDSVALLHGYDSNSHWHFTPWDLTAGERASGRVKFLDEDVEPIPLDDGAYDLEVEVVEEDSAGLLEVDVREETVDLRGTEPGSGKLVLRLYYDGEEAWSTTPLLVRVRE